MKKIVLTIGELLADLISTEFVPSIAQGKTFQLYPGGSPANVCANLRWMDIEAKLVSCVGQDAIGDYLLAYLHRLGIDTAYVARTPHLPTSMVVIGRSAGTPDFVAYRTADTQIGEIPEDLITEASIIHTGAFALSRNPAQHHILDALSLGVSRGKTISIDWNYAPSLWESDGKLVFQKIMSMRPFLKISMDDAQRFFGQPLGVEDTIQLLNQYPAKLICLTCGKDGVWHREAGAQEWTFTPAIPVDNVSDTTGAGDAFWAAFLAAYISGSRVADCIARGIETAARKIRQRGPLYLMEEH